ncbi:MAG: hypothetical protein CVU39_19995 [Chloroflexi bacterium HGW-Chloroflexi-10]|nr:MAG: hypothetical protein CVU39_19995 [Chloroflexi bacterium HGW-Chloroflexi-10]
MGSICTRFGGGPGGWREEEVPPYVPPKNGGGEGSGRFEAASQRHSLAASGLRLQKIQGFGTGSLILELRSIQEKRTCLPDDLFFGQAGLTKKWAKGQTGKVHLSVGLWLL